MAATRIFVANAEASDLCPRDHELGACGRVRLVAFLDGILCGVSEAQPSFPRPRWAPLALARGSAAQLALVLLEADHLQPRRGAAFCYGAASLSLAGLAWQRRLASHGPLENAPGRYGTLSFEVCCDEPPPAPPSAPPQPEAHLVHPMDWCGVLRFAIDFRELSGTWSLEAAAGNGSSPSSGFISWTEEAEKSPVAPKAPQQLFVVERDVVFSAHAGLADRGLAGGCVRQLSQMRGPRGPCNVFLEPHPEPLTMDVAVKQPPQIHLRFFPADYLRPRPGMPCGISVRFTLAAAPPKLQMPLVIHVPAGCFSDQEHRPDASFSISHLGDCAEINLLDPLRLLGRSLWRVSAGFEAQVERGPGLSQLLALSESLVDILAMRLRAGDEKVVTLPVGEHSVVLRVVLAALRVDVPRPVLGIFMPPTDAADELRLEASSQGEVAGIFVHSLAVHSPHVRCCLVTASSDAGALLHPLPHMGGKVFIPAQCDHRGKVVVHAFLPEFGYHAVAETALGDACLQLCWSFGDGSGAAISAAALVTFARWPVEGALSAARVSLRVMRTSIPEQVLPLLTPLSIACGTSAEAFTWTGEDGADHEAILSAGPANTGTLEVQCGRAAATSFSLSDLLLAQSALGFTYELEGMGEQQEDSEAQSYLEEPSRPQRFVFDEAQGQLVPASDTESEGSQEPKDARRARQQNVVQSRVRRKAAPQSTACLSLPVLVEERVGEKTASAFCFLPVRVQNVTEGSEQSGGRVAEGAPGVILLQQLSAFLRLDAHGTASCQGCWEPVPALSLTAGHAGVAARAVCHSAASSPRACAACWAPVSAGYRQCPPHIIRTMFSPAPGEDFATVQIEFRFSCPTCSAATTFTAHGKARLLRFWRPVDVHLSIRGQRGGAACARLMLCPSQLCSSPGLLTLELRSLIPGGPGVAELLDFETEEVRLGRRGPAFYEMPAGVRLAVDKEGGPALLLDGRLEDVSAAGRRRRQLCVELAPEEVLTDVTLEVQALSGARRLLCMLCLAALGPLGDCVVAYHLHFGPRCSLALVCDFEPRRHGVRLRPEAQMVLNAPALQAPGKEQKEMSVKEELKEEQSRRLAEGLRRLKPQLSPPLPRSASASPARGRRLSCPAPTASAPSHPFLERGRHHWLAELPFKAQRKPGITWTQELGRQRPASAERRHPEAKRRHPGHDHGKGATPPGWDHRAEAKDGPKYRAEFLGRQKEKVHQLREDLSKCRAEKERLDQRLGQVRRALRSAQQELEPKHAHQRSSSGLPAEKPSRSARLRSKTDVEPGSALTDAAPQVCAKCAAPVPAEGRFCSGCLPAVQQEALKLREICGKNLVEVAGLRYQLEAEQREHKRLEARRCDLEAQLLAPTEGSSEAAKLILATLAQLRSLRRDDEARAKLDAERLQAFTQRDAAAAAALEVAQERLKQADRQHEIRRQKLERGDKKVKTLLSDIDQTSPARGVPKPAATATQTKPLPGRPVVRQAAPAQLAPKVEAPPAADPAAGKAAAEQAAKMPGATGDDVIRRAAEAAAVAVEDPASAGLAASQAAKAAGATRKQAAAHAAQAAGRAAHAGAGAAGGAEAAAAAGEAAKAAAEALGSEDSPELSASAAADAAAFFAREAGEPVERVALAAAEAAGLAAKAAGASQQQATELLILEARRAASEAAKEGGANTADAAKAAGAARMVAAELAPTWLR